jgi:undecaprenyl-diphosphatase
VIYTIAAIDRSLFLFLNGLHSPFLDLVMWYGTKTVTWIPLFILLIWLVIRHYGWKSLWVFLFAAGMLVISDQLCNLVKESVGRLRPTHNDEMVDIHTVNGYLGGTFGFYSAHASNNLALALFLVKLLGRKVRFFTPLILLWAFFMAYTRIYLGVHYPADILAGWMTGAIIGITFGLICRKVVTAPLAIT